MRRGGEKERSFLHFEIDFKFVLRKKKENRKEEGKK